MAKLKVTVRRKGLPEVSMRLSIFLQSYELESWVVERRSVGRAGVILSPSVSDVQDGIRSVITNCEKAVGEVLFRVLLVAF